MNDEDVFDKAFDGFGEEEKPTEPVAEEPKEETPKVDEPTEEKPTEDPANAEAPDEEKPENSEEPEEPTAPKTEEPVSEQPEAPAPLTKDDLQTAIKDVISSNQNSADTLDKTTEEVVSKYYPDGLSNKLTDSNTGKVLETPQDVVDASGGEMTIEEASQWLINEQFKLDRAVSDARADARKVAETTIKFERDSAEVLQKYEPLFKAFPGVQQKVWDAFKPLVKADEDKGFILSSPDMAQFYDTMLEPYRLAYEQQSQQPATNPVTPPPAPEPPKPTAEDRMDVSGDGGVSEPNDPNNFAQQVEKELSKGA